MVEQSEVPKTDAQEEWDQISANQIVRTVEYNPPTTSEWPSDILRIVCISDTHGKTKDMVLPSGDVLVHAGDFTRRS